MTKKVNPWVRFFRHIVQMPHEIRKLERMLAASELTVGRQIDTIATLRTVENHVRHKIILTESHIETQAKHFEALMSTLQSRIMGLQDELDKIREDIRNEH